MEKDLAALMDVYTLEEILEQCDATPEEVLLFLLENNFISLPEVQPVE